MHSPSPICCANYVIADVDAAMIANAILEAESSVPTILHGGGACESLTVDMALVLLLPERYSVQTVCVR